MYGACNYILLMFVDVLPLCRMGTEQAGQLEGSMREVEELGQFP